MLCEIHQNSSKLVQRDCQSPKDAPDGGTPARDWPACMRPDGVERVATGYEFLEGPVWLPAGSDICRKYDADGLLLFNDIPAGKTYYLVANIIDEFREDNGQSNGNFCGPDNQLFCCEHAGRRVTRVDASGAATTLASQYKGRRLNSPNDLVVSSDKSIWFTDPPYGVATEKRELSFQGVFKLAPDGVLTLITNEFIKPNGLAFSTDEQSLYVADTEAGRIAVLQLAGTSKPARAETFCKTPRPDGIRFDAKGNLWVAGLNGIEIFNSAGGHEAQIQLPERPANLEFGGKDGRTLYICARTSLYRLRTPWAGATFEKRFKTNA